MYVIFELNLLESAVHHSALKLSNHLFELKVLLAKSLIQFSSEIDLLNFKLFLQVFLVIQFHFLDLILLFFANFDILNLHQYVPQNVILKLVDVFLVGSYITAD